VEGLVRGTVVIKVSLMTCIIKRLMILGGRSLAVAR